MLRKIIQTKNQSVKVPRPNSGLRGRNSQRSEISLTNSVVLISSPKISDKNEETLQNDLISSILNSQNNNASTNSANLNPQQKVIQDLKQKMQNVSCLYSDYAYKQTKQNFIDDMKMERYRIMVENQRNQKYKLVKELEETKQQIKKSEKEKQTVMFAYRALEARIKEREKQSHLRSKVLLDRANSKMSISSKNKDQKDQVFEQRRQKEFNQYKQRNLLKVRTSSNSVVFDQEISRSRKNLINQGKLNMDDKQNDPLQKARLAVNFQSLCSSKSFKQLIDAKDGIKQWQDRQRQLNQQADRIQELEKENKQMKLAINRLSIQLKNIKMENTTVSQLHLKAEERVMVAQKLKKQWESEKVKLKQKYDDMQSKFRLMEQQIEDQRKQAKNRQLVIKDLESTKYTYLMKQEKEKQEVQMLRKFTQSLQINDQKISQFIRQNFKGQISDQVMSQSKLYKEDISYILHLVKKKESLYNDMFKQYKDKLRQTETRCFIVEKKLHLTDVLLEEISQATHVEKEFHKLEAKVERLMESYKLDKRLL